MCAEGEQEGNAFGRWVQRRRRALDLTQAALADAVGCSPVTIQKLERGRRRPSYQILDRLADALGIDGPERAAFLRLGRAQRREGALTSPPSPADGAAANPAPQAERRVAGGRLPRPLTPIVGREGDLAELLARLSDPAQRLVTLTGPAGVGKTRLALEAAALLADTLPDGAAFIPLAHVDDPSALAAAIAQGLDEALPAGDPGRALRTLLRERSQLLVLDNFEQILAAAPELVAVLQEAPGLRLLVTSRERLHVRGEHVQPLAPLPTPPPGELPAPAALGANPAVALFCAVARAARPDFALSAANAPDVARLCAGLDGLPLAIEIVAAHADLGSPTLFERLDARHALTLRGPLDLPERQHTLQAAFDWSYTLLELEARRVFASLGVFAPGWDEAAACAVDAAAGRQLATLLRKSLIQPVEGDGVRRYALLETVREYALEQLGAEAEDARLRHAEHYLAVAAQAAVGLRGADQGAWAARLRHDQANLGAALGWLLASGRHEGAARLAADVQRFWWMRGQLGEGRRWLGRVLAAPERIPTPLLARLWHALGNAELAQGEQERAEQSLRHAFAASQSAGEPYLISLSSHALGMVLADRRQYDEARTLLELGLRIDVEQGDVRGQAISLGSLGGLAYHQRDFAAAQDLFEQSLALHRDGGDLHSVALTLNNLAELARRVGDDENAARHLDEALELVEQVDARRMAPYMLNNRVLLLSRAGRVAEARAALARSLALLDETGDRGELVTALLVGAQLRLDAGDPAAAARLLGAAERTVEAAALSLSPVTQDDRDALIARCAALLGDAGLETQRRAGRALDTHAAVGLAAG